MSVVTFPTMGAQKSWTLTEEKHAELLKLFPGLDLDLEFSTMLAWIEKKGPKTANGMNLFLLNWLRRAQKAPPDGLSWNHDRLPPPKETPEPPDDGDRRRMELWKQFEAGGMSHLEAKTASYEQWRKEGHGS